MIETDLQNLKGVDGVDEIEDDVDVEVEVRRCKLDVEMLTMLNTVLDRQGYLLVVNWCGEGPFKTDNGIGS